MIDFKIGWQQLISNWGQAEDGGKREEHWSWVTRAGSYSQGALASWGPLGHLSVPPFLHLCRGRMVTRLNDSYNHNVSKIARVPTFPCSLHLLYIILLFSKAFINMPSTLYILFFFFWSVSPCQNASSLGAGTLYFSRCLTPKVGKAPNIQQAVGINLSHL